MLLQASLSILLASFQTVFATNAEQWRGRSIYQILTDRFALPTAASPSNCDPGKRTWCGGNWNSIRENLDYVQNAGFTAIWISPVNQNYEGPTTVYGDPYHGYWMADISKLNSRFGTAEDLKALSAELHKRNMFLMVDVVVNDVMATSTMPDYSTYMFKDESLYHPYCPIQFGNTTSEQICWLGDDKVPLPDVDTKNPTVVAQYGDWIQNLVQEYNIDGLRIDAAKHVNMDFWPGFCAKAGVFCMGEVFDGTDVSSMAKYQGPQALDSVLNYALYSALRSGFTIPGATNMSFVADMLQQSKTKFKDTGLLGNFLENQDLQRWRNISADPQSMYNAMTFSFMYDGIPIVYYGQEQGFSGNSDPYNREPLWPSNYTLTPAYKLIANLNKFRNFLVNTTDWAKQETKILTTSPSGIAIMKGSVVTVLTNIGSTPPSGIHMAIKTPYSSGTAMTDVLTCQKWAVGSEGVIDAQYPFGGVPITLIPSDNLVGSGLCGAPSQLSATTTGENITASDTSPASSLGITSPSEVAVSATGSDIPNPLSTSLAHPAFSLCMTSLALMWIVLVFCNFS